MTYEEVNKIAREELKDFDCYGYVIIQYPPSALIGFRQAGYSIDYDYELFSTYEELEKFVHGQPCYNFLDFATSLRDGEKIVSVYAKNKLIIVL